MFLFTLGLSKCYLSFFCSVRERNSIFHDLVPIQSGPWRPRPDFQSGPFFSPLRFGRILTGRGNSRSRRFFFLFFSSSQGLPVLYSPVCAAYPLSQRDHFLLLFPLVFYNFTCLRTLGQWALVFSGPGVLRTETSSCLNYSGL